jgi:4-diphosphocytidyl-2-C-methyl-D-erythritol kinase
MVFDVQRRRPGTDRFQPWRTGASALAARFWPAARGSWGLRVRVREDGEIRRVSDLPGVAPDEDLVVRAARLLKEASGTPLGADIEVEKAIPMGGGLGGGSSDAATVLVVLDRLWGTGFGPEALGELAPTLGADVPFFLFGQAAWVEGIGERLQPVELPQRWYLVLAPPVAVPTGEIFAAPELTRSTPSAGSCTRRTSLSSKSTRC